MTWEYRLIKMNGTYGVYEVYYENGKVVSYSSKPTSPRGESLKVIRNDLDRYCEAFEKPPILLE